MTRLKVFSIMLFVVFGLAAYLVAPDHTGARAKGFVGEVPAAPTGVNASDNWYINKVGLRWDAIRGATLYRIYRNSVNNPSAATDVGTTQANFFFDTTSAVGQTYFYWVRAENSAGQSLFGAPDQGTRANGNFPGSTFPPLDPPLESAQNPVTAAKAYLGKTLFWDEQLSSTQTVACGTCHRPAMGGSDPRTDVDDPRSRNPGPDNTFGTVDDIFGSRGVIENAQDGTYSFNAIFGFREQVTNRKSPSYLNAAYSPQGIFWDGRASNEFRDPITNEVVIPLIASLESQSVGPPVSTAEMGHLGRDWTQVAARIQISKPLALASDVPTGLKTWIGDRTYPQLFLEAFGSPDVTPSKIAMAIATHERTLFSDQTPLDKAVAGIQPLTPNEAQGQQVFETNNCASCHLSSLLSDQAFHNIGVRPQSEDPGRFAVTGDEFDRSAFKTPGLRNVELRFPYMHTGRLRSIEDVIDFYNRGGDFDAPNVDHEQIHPLNLTNEQKANLAAFLKRPLTDDRVRNELPPFDRPQLFTESDRFPQITGSGRPGTGGIVPEVAVNSPGLIGNQRFTVGVSRAAGGSQAYLVIDSVDPGVGSSIPGSGSFIHRNIALNGSGAGGGFGSTVFPIPNNPNLVGQTLYGRWYVVDAGAANGFSVSRLFSFKIFSSDSATPHATPFDFDGDGKTDVSVYRPSNNVWYLQRSTAGFTAYQFGAAGDKMVPADYTGDGKTDVAIYRPSNGTWYILRSEDLTLSVAPFGISTDIPTPGDFDGDGKADMAVYRADTQGTFYIQRSTQGFTAVQFGLAGDKPTTADYDGDGKADIAVYRPSTGVWYRFNSSTGAFWAAQFGAAGDKVVPADYTGDGKTDIAVYRPSTGFWYVLRSENETAYGAPFGISTDIPAAGDYDGDGKADLAVYRPDAQGLFYILGSSAGFSVVPFGLAGDVPAPSAYVN
ncbi:MAG TPA: cytochrome c peroxidase [Pyrinomonadaceae bacterium]|nr:cytochrome c peroxidase [Pyrinomonadaceae bacterium]